MQASLVDCGNGKLLRRSTATKTGDLRKDKPHPVAGLSSGTEFCEDCVVDALLRVEKALEVVSVGHALFPRCIFFFPETTVRRQVIVGSAHSRISQDSSLTPTSMFGAPNADTPIWPHYSFLWEVNIEPNHCRLFPMKYDFKTLSPADFEDLARDLVSAELGIRLEGFGPGPDGGIDGRHAEAGTNLILQAKHKAGSNFSSLKSVMKKERDAIDHLDPERYILATSQPLTPQQKAQLAEIIGGALKNVADILGCTDLNDMLSRHPAIEEAHIKLWLSSIVVLKRLLRSAAFAYQLLHGKRCSINSGFLCPTPASPKPEKFLKNIMF